MIHKFRLLHVLSRSWTKDTILLTDFKSSFKNTSGHPHKKRIKQWKYQKKVRFQVAKIFSFRLLHYKHRWQVTHWQKKQMILSAVSLKSLLQKSTKPEARRPNPTKDEKDQHHSTCSCLALHLQPSSFSTSPSNTTHTAHRRNWKDNTTQCYRLYHKEICDGKHCYYVPYQPMCNALSFYNL